MSTWGREHCILMGFIFSCIFADIWYECIFRNLYMHVCVCVCVYVQTKASFNTWKYSRDPLPMVYGQKIYSNIKMRYVLYIFEIYVCTSKIDKNENKNFLVIFIFKIYKLKDFNQIFLLSILKFPKEILFLNNSFRIIIRTCIKI